MSGRQDQVQRIRRYTLLLMVVWSGVLSISLLSNLAQKQQGFSDSLLSEAKVLYSTDIEFRNWIIGHGGVYVPITEETPPSPALAHLPERDITTPSGKPLTLLNSSYAMRQIHHLMAAHGEQLYGNIASLNPINTDNLPDDWEETALRVFEQGGKEISEGWVEISGKPHFRYMRPMVTEEGCLKCHAAYGDQVGDIRGGISITIPMEPLLPAYYREMTTIVIAHLIIWGLGVLGLFVGGRSQQHAQLAVDRSEIELKLLTNSIAHAIFGIDLQGRCTFANQACIEMLGFTTESALLGKNMYQQIHHSMDEHSCAENLSPICRCMRELTAFHVDDQSFCKLDGSCFPVAYWSYPVIRQGECVGGVVTFMDITEQKRISEELKQSQRLLNSIVEYVPAMIFVKSADELRFELLNRAGERILGMSRDNLLGCNDYDFFPSEQADFFTRKDREVLDSLKVEEIPEEPITTADGQEHWLHTFKVGLYNEQGKATHLLGISLDITNSRQEAIKLIQSEHALEEAQRISHIGSWELDLVTDTLSWSDEVYRIFELDREAFSTNYEGFLKIIHPGDRERVDQVYRDSLIRQDNYEIEHRLLMPDGRIKYVVERCETVFDETGKALRSNGTVQDISHRKQAEMALQESKQRYDDLVQRIPVGIYLYHFMADGRDRFDYVSPQFCKILGIDQLAVLENPRLAFEQSHPDDFPALMEANRQAFLGQKLFAWEGRFLVAGEVRWLKIDSSPVILENGESLWNGVVSDVTDRKNAQQATLHANRALHALSTVNRELMHASNEIALLNAICRAVVENRDYQLALVGYLLPDQEQIQLMGSAGDGDGLLQQIAKGFSSSEMTQYAQLISIGKTAIYTEIHNDPLYRANRESFQQHDYHSSIILPLKVEGMVLGMLHVFADEKSAFAEKEVRLLEEMAGDLAFGIQSLRIRQERDQAMQLNEQHLGQMHETLHQTVVAISKAVEARDPYTAGHQRRVAELACSIARKMGLDEDTVEGINMGATIHDIGKIQIPAELLAKPSRLSEIEYQLIQGHSTVGYEILRDIHFPWPVAKIAHQHHERMDGSGYPQGLKGNQICLEARIVAVADVVEAMSSHRPYRPGLGIELALEEIKQKQGAVFDAEVVDACLALFSEGFGWD